MLSELMEATACLLGGGVCGYWASGSVGVGLVCSPKQLPTQSCTQQLPTSLQSFQGVHGYILSVFAGQRRACTALSCPRLHSGILRRPL
jgi:hypothetical protein